MIKINWTTVAEYTIYVFIFSIFYMAIYAITESMPHRIDVICIVGFAIVGAKLSELRRQLKVFLSTEPDIADPHHHA